MTLRCAGRRDAGGRIGLDRSRTGARCRSGGAQRRHVGREHERRQGTTFSAPEVVATASIRRKVDRWSASRCRTPGRTVRLPGSTWAVPAGYVEGVGGRRIPANATPGPIGLDDITVRLDGCQSVPGTGSIVSRQWTVDGDDLPATDCAIELTVPDGEQREGEARDRPTAAGESASMTTIVAPKNHVVVSLGDSIASRRGQPAHSRRRMPRRPLPAGDRWR